MQNRRDLVALLLLGALAQGDLFLHLQLFEVLHLLMLGMGAAVVVLLFVELLVQKRDPVLLVVDLRTQTLRIGLDEA